MKQGRSVLHGRPSAACAAVLASIIGLSAPLSPGAYAAAPEAQPSPASAEMAERPTISDFAFVEGAWRSENGDRVFEETWTAPAAGMMTGMGRGYEDSAIRLLEYILVEQRTDGVFMRLRQFNPDLSLQVEQPVELRAVDVRKNDVTFKNEDPEAAVRSVRYWSPVEGELRTDVELSQNGAPISFSVHFVRLPAAATCDEPFKDANGGTLNVCDE